MNEEQVVKACLKGDKNAQKQLYEQYARRMMGVCLRYSNGVEDAEDFLQEGFIKVFEKLSSYEYRGSLEGWVRKIIINVVLDRLRQQADLQINDSIDDYIEMASTENPYQHLNAKELLQTIQQLPIGYRTIFNLFAIEGYSHKEISMMLNIAESTSKSQYGRAKEQLQKKIIAERNTVQR